jgi:hypothetical protein
METGIRAWKYLETKVLNPELFIERYTLRYEQKFPYYILTDNNDFLIYGVCAPYEEDNLIILNTAIRRKKIKLKAEIYPTIIDEKYHNIDYYPFFHEDTKYLGGYFLRGTQLAIQYNIDIPNSKEILRDRLLVR